MYLGQGGAWSREETERLLSLRAQGATWGDIGAELDRYKEEVCKSPISIFGRKSEACIRQVRVRYTAVVEREKTTAKGRLTPEEDAQLIRAVDAWVRHFLSRQGLDPADPGIMTPAFPSISVTSHMQAV